MAVYRRNCDQCGNTFKRGIRMDLLVNRVSVLSGETMWDPTEDEEHFATFCSELCMISYIAQRMGLDEEQACA